MTKHITRAGRIIPFLAIAAVVGGLAFAGTVPTIPTSHAQTSGTTFNTDPQDFPVLEVSNYTQNPGCRNCWSPSINNVAANDVVAFVFYYHNTGQVPASNTYLKLIINTSGNGIVGNGRVIADNASAVFGTAQVNLASNVQGPVTLSYVGSEWYPDSTQNPNLPGTALPGGQSGAAVTQAGPGVSVGTVQPDGSVPFSHDGQFVARYRVNAQTQQGNPTLTIQPPSASVNVGQSIGYQALYDPDGPTGPQQAQDVTNAANWQSQNTSIASSQGGGFFRGVSQGSTGIMASYNGLSASASITVTPNICQGQPTLVINPPSASVNVGQTYQFHALYDADGPGCPQGEQDVSGSASWQSQNASIASSQGSGNFRGNAQGTAPITATYQGITATATLTVMGGCDVAPSLVINPSSASVNVGQTYQFHATYSSCNGQQDVTNAANWQSQNTSIASSQGSGNFRGNAQGTAPILASYNGTSATASLLVNQNGCQNPQATLVINPPSATVSVGSTYQFQALYDPDGPGCPQGQQDVTGSANWQSQNFSIAQSQGNGVFRGLSQGTAPIIASYAGLTATASLTVTGCSNSGCGCQGQQQATLVITPPSASVNVGSTYRFQALYDPDGPGCPQGQQDVSGSANWSSQNTYIASSQGGGSFLGNNQGTTGITANYSGLTANASLAVNGNNNCFLFNCPPPPPPPYQQPTLVIVPPSATVNVGQTYQYQALYDPDGPSGYQGQQDVTGTAFWQSLAPGVATQNGGGSFRGNAQGTAPITARYNGILANASLLVQGQIYQPPVYQPPVVYQPPTVIQQPPTIIGGGTVIARTGGGNVLGAATGNGEACLIVTPTVDVTQLRPGTEFVYTTFYRNDCAFTLNNAILRVYLPAEVDFLASSNPYFIREGQKFSYPLGALQPGAQGSVAIRGVVRNDAQLGQTLLFTSMIEFVDGTGRTQNTTSYLSAILGENINKPFTASITDTLGSFIRTPFFWLLLVLIIIALAIWLILSRRRPAASATATSGGTSTAGAAGPAGTAGQHDDPLRGLRNA